MQVAVLVFDQRKVLDLFAEISVHTSLAAGRHPVDVSAQEVELSLHQAHRAIVDMCSKCYH
jgi:hypothetical protein